eukprot:1884839-Amphidinium_carterae.2
MMLDILTPAAPRRVELSGLTKPAVLFADGSLDPTLQEWEVPSDILSSNSSWRNVAKHPIVHVELFAYVLARAVWSKLLAGYRFLAFIDSEVALHALIAAGAKSDSLVAVLSE